VVLLRAYRRAARLKPTTGALRLLTCAAEGRLDRLDLVVAGLGALVTPSDRRLLSYVVIEAANLWAQYSRCFYLSCALGARDDQGQSVVPARAATLDAALTLSVHAVRPAWRGSQRQWTTRDLPDFQNKGILAKTVRYVQATVSPDVDRALAYQSRVLTDLPPMRNFFAHKAERAANAARGLAPRYGHSRTTPPESLLCAVPRGGGGDILVREWLADLRAILQLMP
jgi:hypothetical protein